MSYNVVNKTVYDTLADGHRLMTTWLHNRGLEGQPIFLLNSDALFKTVLRSGYILILLSIEYILASLIETCQ